MAYYEPVEGIQAVPPRPSLLTGARKLPESIVWRTGIAFRQASLAVGYRWPYAPIAEHDDKIEPEAPGVAQFLPFTIYVPSACDEVTYQQEESHRLEAETQLEAVTAWNVARELWTGETLSVPQPAGNPSLQSPVPGVAFDATHIISGGAADPLNQMAALIAAWQECSQTGGVTIHAPVILAPYLLSEKIIGQEGDMYRGPAGSVVVLGPGYPSGSGDWGPRESGELDSGAAATGAQAWMYATGIVEVGTGPVTAIPEERAARYFDRRTNQYHVWAERQAIYRFDPACVFAALATTPTNVP